MKNQIIKDMGIILFYAAVLSAVAGGWIANIVKIFSSGFDPLTGEVVLRIIGVFLAPIGVIMGFI